MCRQPASRQGPQCQLQAGACQEHLPVTEQRGHLPSASAETEPCATAAVDLQHPLRKFRVENGALNAPEKLMEQVFIWLDIFRNWFHDPDLCITPYLEKH